MANHTKTYGLEARKYDTTDFQDASVKRILKKLSDLERAALPDAQLREVQARRKKKQEIESEIFWQGRNEIISLYVSVVGVGDMTEYHVTFLKGISVIHDMYHNIVWNCLI